MHVEATAGDFEDAEIALEDAQLCLALTKPVDFPDWIPLWESSYQRLFCFLRSHIQAQEMCEFPPLLKCPAHSLNLHHSIFVPPANLSSHNTEIRWPMPAKYKHNVLEIMKENEMRPLTMFDIGLGVSVDFTDYSKFLHRALVDVNFHIIHSVHDHGTHRQHMFMGELVDVTILGQHDII